MVKDLNNVQLLSTLVLAAYDRNEECVQAIWYEALRRLDNAYYDDATVIIEKE